MEKLKTIILIWLLTSQILLTNSLKAADVLREFSALSFEQLVPKLHFDAPIDSYVVYNLNNGWLVMNSFFFKNIHLKLAKCDEHFKMVEPLKDAIIKEEPWWSTKLLIVGLPASFSLGLILGAILK